MSLLKTTRFPCFNLVLVSLLWLSFVIALPVHSHEVRPSYLEIIQQNKDTFSVMWKVPAKGSDLRLGLYVEFSEEVEHLTQPVERFSGGSYIKKWRIRHPHALIESKIFIQGLHSTFTEALVRIERLDGMVQIERLMPESPSFIVQASPSSGQLAKAYTGLGIKHILLGFDHLLFLLCLLFIAGGGKRLIITVTGFTLAHSITLALSALNIVNVQIVPIEAIIALSILFLATEIVKGQRNTLTWNYPVAVSASFGLLHGFGFAAVLDEIGLPQTEQLTALLFFNVGVEVGQLFFVLTVLLVIKGLLLSNVNIQHYLWKNNSQKISAYLVGSLAAFWLIERSVVFF